MKLLIGLCLLVSMSLLQSCATLSKAECLQANWYLIGLDDGQQGLLPERLSQHRKACAKHEVSADFVEYSRGRIEGLEEFCTHNNGFRVGELGRAYSGACPTKTEQEFLSGYRVGRQFYAARSELEWVLGSLRHARHQRRELLHRLTHKTEWKNEPIVDDEKGDKHREQYQRDKDKLAELRYIIGVC